MTNMQTTNKQNNEETKSIYYMSLGQKIVELYIHKYKCIEK